MGLEGKHGLVCRRLLRPLASPTLRIKEVWVEELPGVQLTEKPVSPRALLRQITARLEALETDDLDEERAA